MRATSVGQQVGVSVLLRMILVFCSPRVCGVRGGGGLVLTALRNALQGCTGSIALHGQADTMRACVPQAPAAT